MATLQELERALVNAHNAGDADAARKLAVVIKSARENAASRIPDAQIPGTEAASPETSLGEKIVGAGEAGLAAITGATGGALGMAGGMVKGMAKEAMTGQFGTPQAANRIEQEAARGAQALTYAPRTQAGQEITQAVGEFAAPIAAALPSMPISQMTQLAQAARPVAQVAGTMARAGAARAAPAVQRAAQATQEAMQSVAQKTKGAAFGDSSAGAAETPASALRRERAAQLPAPVRMTAGEATRDAEQLAFEKAQKTNPELGAPLRERAEETNLALLRNLDIMIDRTDAPSGGDIMASSRGLVRQLSEGADRSRTKVRTLYRQARNSEESRAEVDTGSPVRLNDEEAPTTLAGWLNSRVTGVRTSDVTDTARRYAVRMGILGEDENGQLVPRRATVGELEDFRKEITGIANPADRAMLRDETIIKSMIDQMTEPVAGPLYSRARAARRQEARLFENRAIVADLIRNKKGMDDPAVAIDRVFNRVVMNSSPDELKFLRRVVRASGPDGRDTWNDMRASALRHIQEQASKGVAPDSQGRPVMSTAQLHRIVSEMDRKGVLDQLFDKRQAELIRDINAVARDVNTVPPGTLINTSGTAMTLMAALAEAGAMGALSGLPVPVVSVLRQASAYSKDRALRARIQRALNQAEAQGNRNARD